MQRDQKARVLCWGILGFFSCLNGMDRVLDIASSSSAPALHAIEQQGICVQCAEKGNTTPQTVRQLSDCEHRYCPACMTEINRNCPACLRGKQDTEHVDYKDLAAVELQGVCTKCVEQGKSDVQTVWKPFDCEHAFCSACVTEINTGKCPACSNYDAYKYHHIAVPIKDAEQGDVSLPALVCDLGIRDEGIKLAAMLKDFKGGENFDFFDMLSSLRKKDR